MASAVATQHVRSCLKFASFDHDPDATSATIVTPDAGTTLRYWDMRDLTHFAVLAMASTLTGNGITKLEIVASETTSFSSVTVIKDSGTVAADAVGDQVVEECSAEEIAHLGEAAGLNLRYVAGRLTCQNSADEAVVTYIGMPVRKYLNLTPATTIA